MELVADDRERAVIAHLEHKLLLRVERLTIGDYAFVRPDGRLAVIVERKTLEDLAASIKDGRMENNAKLLHAQAETGCHIIYIIEGPAYPKDERKFGGIPFKCLEGKLDSLTFRHGARVVWTKDAEHTASRLAAMAKRLPSLTPEAAPAPAPAPGVAIGASAVPADCVRDLLQSNMNPSLDVVHMRMLSKIPTVSFGTAKVVLARYSIRQVITGDVSKEVLVNLQYESKFRLGERGEKLWRCCQSLSSDNELCIRMLGEINGVTLGTARAIVAAVDMANIVTGEFAKGAIACVPKSKNRRVGPAIEERIKLTFAS